MVEPDIDYYQDLAAHAILEVIPNALTHSLTNPVEVYVLRWIAGRTAGMPEFAPPVHDHFVTKWKLWVVRFEKRMGFRRRRKPCYETL